jgi:hypothetical protein
LDAQAGNPVDVKIKNLAGIYTRLEIDENAEKAEWDQAGCQSDPRIGCVSVSGDHLSGLLTYWDKKSGRSAL